MSSRTNEDASVGTENDGESGAAELRTAKEHLDAIPELLDHGDRAPTEVEESLAVEHLSAAEEAVETAEEKMQAWGESAAAVSEFVERNAEELEAARAAGDGLDANGGGNVSKMPAGTLRAFQEEQAGEEELSVNADDAALGTSRRYLEREKAREQAQEEPETLRRGGRSHPKGSPRYETEKRRLQRRNRWPPDEQSDGDE